MQPEGAGCKPVAVKPPVTLGGVLTVGHRRRVTAVTRLPRWRRRKTRLHVMPLFTMLQGMDRCRPNPSLLARATFNQGFHSQANPGYRCHQCNGPCGYRTPGRSLQSPTPKPLGHKGTWTKQSLTIDWFVTPAPNGSQIIDWKVR